MHGDEGVINRPVTMRDLLLGTVTLTDQQKERLRERAAPLLARVAARLMSEGTVPMDIRSVRK